MKRQLLFVLTLLLLMSARVLAGAPTPGEALPTLNIEDRGELILDGSEFSFVPWSSDKRPQQVHVIQYFGANLGDRDVFEPFTDMIQQRLPAGSVHVTTVLNMDAAMWGTTGMVLSELKKNKKKHPESTMVIDEEGAGVKIWELGKAGTGLMIIDTQGVVKFFTRGSLPEDQLASTIELIRENLAD
ncbi:MAG: YtfJ family protein [Halioglobus sp.]